MKKIKLFILIVFILNTIFFTKIFTYASYNTYVKVGLLKTKNVESVHLDNSSILVGYGNNNEFIERAKISSNYGFDIKSIGNYYIKLTQKFSTYEDAYEYSANNINMFTVLENDSWKVYLKGFNSIAEGQLYIKDNNLLAEVVSLSDIIGIYSNSELLFAYTGNKPFQIKQANEYLSIDGKVYRNVLQINVNSRLLSVVNILDIEQYLYGVVPAEMPYSWHIEALKAQAVAARNYIYTSFNIHYDDGFDVCDTVHCQVYAGVSSEKESTTRAVDETKGVLAYYNDEIINTVYSSSNGGYSDNSENVWNNKIDYLRAIKDDEEEGAKVWERTYTFDELSNLANNIGNVNEIILEKSDVTGRALSLRLIGDTGEKILQKEEIRTFFSKSPQGSLESRNFVMKNSTTTNNNETSLTPTTLHVIDKYGVKILNQQEAYIISSNMNILKQTPKTLLNNQDKLFNINDDTTNQNNQTDKDTGNVDFVRRVDYNSVTFSGKGWGHGVGMSQYGAHSLAKKGYKYDEILKYYYTGITVR